MGLQFDALLTNGTWSLCPRPLHQHIVRNKWVYKIKRKQDDSIEQYKACLVAKGFDQKCGIDFTETFSPVIKPSTICVVLTLAVHFNWCIRQLMEQTQGFIDYSQPNHLCRLHKSLYGLK
jgi:hypothetical protein